MTVSDRNVFGGVDTHADVHVAAVIDEIGGVIDTAEFDTTASGYRRLVSWMRSQGGLVKVGVEGTGSYGAGLARHLGDVGIRVVEVNRPNRQMRRRHGKSDRVDAIAAARSALSGDATGCPKDSTGVVEAIRVLRVAFRSARRARTQVGLQIRDLIVTGPESLRAKLGSLSTAERVQRCACFRPGGDLADPATATRTALRTLARRHQRLDAEVDQLRGELDRLTRQANPALRAAKGVGVDVAAILLITAGQNPERITSEAAFAALCGVSPIQASSGKTRRHRLNRNGDRQANHALWRIAFVRLHTDERTRTYAARRRAEGKTDREILRCLKRYIAREMFRLLTKGGYVPDTSDLRPARHAAGLSLKTVAEHFDTWPGTISELERGIRRNDDLEHRYRTWLNTQHAV